MYSNDIQMLQILLMFESFSIRFTVILYILNLCVIFLNFFFLLLKETNKDKIFNSKQVIW